MLGQEQCGKETRRARTGDDDLPRSAFDLHFEEGAMVHLFEGMILFA